MQEGSLQGLKVERHLHFSAETPLFRYKASPFQSKLGSICFSLSLPDLEGFDYEGGPCYFFTSQEISSKGNRSGEAPRRLA